jgi:glycine cleavage system H protein
MTEKRYTKKHEWIEVNGNSATIGITSHATTQLGDIVFVELPQLQKVFEKDQAAAVVESVKAASDVYCPLSGEITDINKKIVDDPSIVNKDPESKGWFFKIKIKNQDELKQLMTKEEYTSYSKENPN